MAVVRRAYRTDRVYQFGSNESRADLVESALDIVTDKQAWTTDPRGVFTDVSDLLAHVRHFCDRAGLDYGEVDEHAYRAYLGDHEDSPTVERDTDRFPTPRTQEV